MERGQRCEHGILWPHECRDCEGDAMNTPDRTIPFYACEHGIPGGCHKDASKNDRIDIDARRFDRLCKEHALLLEALHSGIATLEQFVKLGRIPENNQGLREMRAALAECEEGPK
jgi:hypothetical protein